MGLIARILDSFTGNSGEPAAKVEIYKGDNATAKVFNPPGVDARPLDGDYGFSQDSEDTEGGKDVLGFIDPKNAPVSEKGENRFYSRDSSGTIVAIVYLDKTGKIIVEGPGEAIIFDLLKHQHLDSWGLPTTVPLNQGAPIPSPPATVTLQSNLNTNSKQFDGVIYDQHGHPYTWTDPGGSDVTGVPQ